MDTASIKCAPHEIEKKKLLIINNNLIFYILVSKINETNLFFNFTSDVS